MTRLIDADKLKEELSWLRIVRISPELSKTIFLTIDNAPTIEHSKNSLDYDYGFAEVSLRVCFMFHSDKVEQPTPKITKPDTDNMLKLLKDCMTIKNFWKDDAHVTVEQISKYWVPGPEGILIEVEEVKST